MSLSYSLIQRRKNYDFHFVGIWNKAGSVSSLWPSKTLHVSISLILCIILLSSIESFGSEWKYLGRSTGSKGKHEIVFYDSETIEYTKDMTIKVWTKTFKLDEIISVKNKYKNKVVGKSAAKRKAHYYPPYTLAYPKTSYDDYVEITIWEEVVNSFKIKSLAKVLFEVDCDDTMIRSLSMVSYKYIGDIESRRKIAITGAWDRISPKSNADTLQKILCKENFREK